MESKPLTLIGFNYAFTPDGAIVPWGEFSTGMSDAPFVRFDLSQVNDGHLSIGDVVICTCPDTFDESSIAVDGYNLVNLKTIQYSNSGLVFQSPSICPICQSPLIKHGSSRTKCINRDCAAQLPFNLLQFSAAIGLLFSAQSKVIIDTLLSRGSLVSIAHLFHLNENDTSFLDMNRFDVNVFLQYISSVRSTATVPQILMGLRVPGFTHRSISELSLIFASQHWSTEHLIFLLDPKFAWTNEQDKCLWWEFINVPNNARLINELSNIFVH